MSSRFSAVSIVAIVALALPTASLAVQYDFLTVNGNNIPGNLAQSTFTSQNFNGTIPVSHFFPTNGWGLDDNDNAAINPSKFATLFPANGNVQGHLAQTVYGHRSVVSFDLTNYKITQRTVFGMWNTSDEVVSPGGFVYRIQLLNANSVQKNPTTFDTIGNDDNTGTGGVIGDHEMLMDPNTGSVTFGAPINSGAGVHTNARFWKGIPKGTQQILVFADLPTLNTIGDGVGYYFADVPEPTSVAISAVGLISLGLLKRRRRR